MMLITENNNFEMMEEAQRALAKLDKYNKKTAVTPLYESIYKATAGAEFFEVFDDLAWNGKIRVDSLYFDQLLLNLEENENVYKLLGEYFKNIKQIYEFVNLKPDLYGKDINLTIFEQSTEKQHNLLSNVIYEYFDKTFYSLTPKQRKEKYLEESRHLSKQLISEGVDAEEAMTYSTKVCIVENLLEKIAFPFAVKSRIDYLLESEDYRKVFDQAALADLVDDFNKKKLAISKIISTVV